MFSRFTEKAIQFIMQAQEEAKRLSNDFVGTEHILLGLIHSGAEDNIAIKTLQELGVSVSEIEQMVQEHVEYGSKVSKQENIPFTSQVKHVLSMSWDEARQLGHSYVGTEHLFLALLREQDGIAAKILSELKISLYNPISLYTVIMYSSFVYFSICDIVYLLLL